MYDPKQGDLIFLNFSPQSGHEQAGRRPSLVVSNKQFQKYTNGFAMVCPITNTKKPFPFHVSLDERTNMTGTIMCEQIKSLDLVARNAEYKETLPDDLLKEVLTRIELSIK